MNFKTIEVGPLATNCYILYNETAVVIDPGAEPEKILAETDDLSVKITHIIYTHAHWDHIGAADELKEKTAAEIIMGQNEAETLKSSSLNLTHWLGIEYEPAAPGKYVQDNEILCIGGLNIKVLETPGHTPGGISLLCAGCLFCGDTIFFNSIGRTDLPGGDMDQLISSIENKIYILDDNVKLYPGHGPASSVGREKKNNPFCRAK